VLLVIEQSTRPLNVGEADNVILTCLRSVTEVVWMKDGMEMNESVSV